LINEDLLKYLLTIQNHPELQEKYQNEDTRRKYIWQVINDVLKELPKGSSRINFYNELMKNLFPPEHVKRAAAVKAAEETRKAAQKEVDDKQPSKSAGRRRTQKASHRPSPCSPRFIQSSHRAS
jgi:hypothetical protein